MSSFQIKIVKWILLASGLMFLSPVYAVESQSKGLGFHFIEAMTLKLIENRFWITAVQASDFYVELDYLPVISGFAVYRNKIKNIDYIKRDIAIRSVSGAVTTTIEQTPLGQRFKKIEKKVSSYLKVEYSKATSASKGHFYLPGDEVPASSPKDYAITFNSSLYTSADSLEGAFKFKLNMEYHRITMALLYDCGEHELNLSISNLNLGLTLIKNHDKGSAGLMQFSINF